MSAVWHLLCESLPKGGLGGFGTPLATALVAMAVVLATTPFAMKLAQKFGAMDDPTRDERRVHTQVTPRWGGLPVWLGIVVAWAAVLPFAYPQVPVPPYLICVFVASLIVLAMGLTDDVKPLSAKAQLLILLAAGLGVQAFGSDVGRVHVAGVNLAGHWIDFGWWSYPLTAVYIFVVSKTMDTIDGIDGLASGIATISAGTIGVIGVIEGQPRVAILAMAVAGACLGFLRYNYNPAKIFLAGGAPVVGFLLASLSVVGTMKTAATLALAIPIFIFGIPLFDAGFVVVRRLLSGSPISSPDKRHVHHTLLKFGFTQKQAVWILYLAAIALSGVILFLVRSNG